MSESIYQQKNKPVGGNRAGVSQRKAGRVLADNRDVVQTLVQRQPNNTGLPNNLKSGMENLSGMSLDHVRVHRNSSKPAAVQAHAYAQGSDIHLASGQESHLPHELGHVVQQMQGRVQPTTSVGGIAVNDNAGLESEATKMGEVALQRVGIQNTGSAPVLKEIDKGIVSSHPVINLIKKKKYASRSVKRRAERQSAEDKFKNAVKKAVSIADSTNKGQLVKLPAATKEYQEVKKRVEKNVSELPYATDAFHETQDLMKNILAVQSTFSKMQLACTALWNNAEGGKTFNLSVTSIYKVVNPTARDAAFNQLLTGGHGNDLTTSRELYAGHSKSTTKLVVEGGYRPDLGGYDERKGYGALGRGSYFSDQAAKAATYGGLDSRVGGSLVISDVIEGNQKVVTKGNEERHKTHNSMVKRGGHNIRMPQGVNREPDDSRYDSIMGSKTYESGANARKAIQYTNVFDSNEIAIRNADQIKPTYKINYKVHFN